MCGKCRLGRGLWFKTEGYWQSCVDMGVELENVRAVGKG